MRDKIRKLILWGSVLVLGPLVGLADAPSASSPGAPGHCDRGMHGPGPGGGPGRGAMGFGEETRPPPLMMNVALTEEQQDKVFAILHAAAPALREREKAARKAREALHQLVRASSFSDSSASALAMAQGAAESQLALLQTKMEHDVYAVLTPEQQSKVANRDEECDFHGRGVPPPGGMPPPPR